mmetsp:Transcript_89402/g.208148  ORF Transcript_89402/g.208148 Transcript_89402/m.208148 type:complete len:216 (+) Transcript_89402:46-693(+)
MAGRGGAAGARQEAVATARAAQLPWGTTMLVVRNIPFGYTQEELLQELALTGQCDYFSLPTSQSHPGNVGYAFAHFIDPQSAVAFTSQWHGRALTQHSHFRRLNVTAAQRPSVQENMARVRPEGVMPAGGAVEPVFTQSGGEARSVREAGNGLMLLQQSDVRVAHEASSDPVSHQQTYPTQSGIPTSRFVAPVPANPAATVHEMPHPWRVYFLEL